MRRDSNSFVSRMFLTAAAWTAVVGLTWAAENNGTSETTDRSGPPLEEEAQEALDWLDRYLTVQVIFDQEDILELREEVAKMSPEQLQDWLDATKRLRERLDSPEWGKTREYFRDFLSKQATYSDEEIAEMRKEAAEMTPDQLIGLLDRIEEKIAEMSGMARVSKQRRQIEVEGRDLRAARQREARQQQDQRAISARNELQASQSAAASRAATSGRGAPFFGSSQSKAAQSSARSQYRPPAPLINSSDAARRAVSRSVFGGYGWGW